MEFSVDDKNKIIAMLQQDLDDDFDDIDDPYLEVIVNAFYTIYCDDNASFDARVEAGLYIYHITTGRPFEIETLRNNPLILSILQKQLSVHQGIRYRPFIEDVYDLLQ